MANIKAKNRKTGVEYEFSKDEFSAIEKNPLMAGKYVVDKIQEPKEVAEMKNQAASKTTTSGSKPETDAKSGK